MAETITFLSADEPPVSFTIPRLALFTSVVFRNMLEDATKTAEPIKLDDKGSQLKLFFEVLESKTPDFDDGKIKDEDWEGLARLADKYDSEMVKTTVRAYMWSLVGTKQKPLLAFTLASIIIERAALRASAADALSALATAQNSQGRLPRFGASVEFKTALDRYHKEVQEAACKAIVLYHIEPKACRDHDCTAASYLEQWLNCHRRAMERHIDPHRPFSPHFFRAQPFNPEDDYHIALLEAQDDNEEMGVVELCNRHRGPAGGGCELGEGLHLTSDADFQNLVALLLREFVVFHASCSSFGCLLGSLSV